MEKNCDNCKYECDCNIMFEDWDTSKDFCSKWEEKEYNFEEKLQSIIAKKSKHHSEVTIEIMDLFKQRIEESLGEARDPNRAREGKDKVDYEYRQAFSWILDNVDN